MAISKSVSFDDRTYWKIMEYSKKTELSFSNVIKRAINKALPKLEKDKELIIKSEE